MDYAFHLKLVMSIPDDLLADLAAVVSRAVLRPETSYFVPGRHPGLTSGGFVFDRQTPEPINRLRSVLGEVLPVEACLSYAINRLEPNGFMREHTDAAGGPQSRGMFINSQHLIHVSVTGNASYGFRRSLEVPPTGYTMFPGGVYALNNYVYHNVVNLDDTVRHNILVYYKDPDWKIKQSLYARLGVKSTDY